MSIQPPRQRLQQTRFLTVDAVLSRGCRSRLRVTGELDLASAGLLEDALDDELRMKHRYVRVDVSELTFCDGAGIDMLDRAHTRFGDAGGELRLTHCTPQVTRLMELTRHLALMRSSTHAEVPVESPQPQAAVVRQLHQV